MTCLGHRRPATADRTIGRDNICAPRVQQPVVRGGEESKRRQKERGTQNALVWNRVGAGNILYYSVILCDFMRFFRLLLQLYRGGNKSRARSPGRTETRVKIKRRKPPANDFGR